MTTETKELPRFKVGDIRNLLYESDMLTICGVTIQRVTEKVTPDTVTYKYVVTDIDDKTYEYPEHEAMKARNWANYLLHG